MRIVGGRWRGRRIKRPDDDRVRPTADRVREAWISIVLPDLHGARVLDLFAGSGALGLEALSRGAHRAVFVELAARSLRALKENVETLEAGSSVEIVRGDALKYLEQLAPRSFDVAFADPPYRMQLGERVAQRWLESPFALVLGVEHDPKEDLPHGGDTRRYGDSAITFYRA